MIEIVAGDSANFTDEFPGYLASAGWQLSYVLMNIQKEHHVTYEATANGDGFERLIRPSDSAQLPAGIYERSAVLSLGDLRKTYSLSSVNVLPDPSNAYDSRSYPEKMLAAIEAVLENRASRIEAEYTTSSGRQLKLLSPDELIVLRSRFMREVNTQKNKALGLSGRIVPRFK